MISRKSEYVFWGCSLVQSLRWAWQRTETQSSWLVHENREEKCCMYLPAGLQQTRGIFKQTMFANGDLPSHNAENPVHVLVSGWVRSGVCLRAAVWVLRVHVVSQEVERKLQLCDCVTQQGMAVSSPFAQNWSSDQNGQIWLSFPGANRTQEPLRRASRHRLTVTGNRKYLPPPESQLQTPETVFVLSSAG